MGSLDALSIKLPAGFFTSIEETCLLGVHADSAVDDKKGGARRVLLRYDLPEGGAQDDYFVRLQLAFQPRFFWSPHLTPEEGYIAEQHVFRTPALIASGEGRTAIVIPDIEAMEASPVRYYMDMDAPGKCLYVGMSESEIAGHVLYRKAVGAAYPAGKVAFGFYLMLFDEELADPFRPVLDFFWRKYGRSQHLRDMDSGNALSRYAGRTYSWAFGSWKNVVWQEFLENGVAVGAPAFIVTASQSPNHAGVPREREARSIWNQAWFCSLRSASGLYRHARRTGNAELMEYARKTKELALSFPQRDGLFDAVVATEMEPFLADGKAYQRSKGWGTRYYGNSDRNPFGKDIRTAPRHILDMSFTAYHMLMWYDELERDERLARYALRYAERLVKLQDARGFYPGWVGCDGRGMGVLDDSPESAMSAAFLLRCHALFGAEAYRRSALKAVNAVMSEIVPAGRWEDFEAYWSCSRWWGDHVGEPIARNGMYKSCNFSMYFTALALLLAYRSTEERKYLDCGRRVLDELLMTQASYQPSFMAIPVLGGFGVMNADAEWNDARQSLFAELILQYGMIYNEPEYVERGLSALRASFSMMYCPENPDVKTQWEKVWPFFNEKDYGFNMENYGHNGRTDSSGLGIGEFTIYDWGNGAASESYERMLDHWGREMIEHGRK